MKPALFWSIFFLALGPVAQAENPIVVGQGLTDPKVRVYATASTSTPHTTLIRRRRTS